MIAVKLFFCWQAKNIVGAQLCHAALGQFKKLYKTKNPILWELGKCNSLGLFGVVFWKIAAAGLENYAANLVCVNKFLASGNTYQTEHSTF